MSSARTLVLLSLASCRAFPGPTTTTCLNGPCGPGNEVCGKPFGKDAPQYHLMDQHGCGENDPNGPVFDPVHGVIHHFYQIHLAAPPGRGPDYGHFVSKDFVHWAPLPVAIWNGLDSSVWPPRPTLYDNEAIYTGSAVVVDGAGPGGEGPGVIQIYPGLCNKKDWPGCETGTLLAQAVPADYAHDELLTNWSKPSYNPIVEGTQRDPSSPWKMASGEWRLRTYDSKVPHAWFGLRLRVRLRARLGASDPDPHRGPRQVYGSASDADMLSGRWYEIGTSRDLRRCECPSFYPLPAATPGFEAAYAAAAAGAALPTHVHKTSCAGDWWQLGTYSGAAPRELGNFTPTAGWEDAFEQRRIDAGHFYASKDNAYPTKVRVRVRVRLRLRLRVTRTRTAARARTLSLPRQGRRHAPHQLGVGDGAAAERADVAARGHLQRGGARAAAVPDRGAGRAARTRGMRRVGPRAAAWGAEAARLTRTRTRTRTLI